MDLLIDIRFHKVYQQIFIMIGKSRKISYFIERQIQFEDSPKFVFLSVIRQSLEIINFIIYSGDLHSVFVSSPHSAYFLNIFAFIILPNYLFRLIIEWVKNMMVYVQSFLVHEVEISIILSGLCCPLCYSVICL